jgi:hypothetical protein
MMAVNSHLLVRQWDEDGDRRDACPTPPATPFGVGLLLHRYG